MHDRVTLLFIIAFFFQFCLGGSTLTNSARLVGDEISPKGYTCPSNFFQLESSLLAWNEDGAYSILKNGTVFPMTLPLPIVRACATSDFIFFMNHRSCIYRTGYKLDEFGDLYDISSTYEVFYCANGFAGQNDSFTAVACSDAYIYVSSVSTDVDQNGRVYRFAPGGPVNQTATIILSQHNTHFSSIALDSTSSHLFGLHGNYIDKLDLSTKVDSTFCSGFPIFSTTTIGLVITPYNNLVYTSTSSSTCQTLLNAGCSPSCALSNEYILTATTKPNSAVIYSATDQLALQGSGYIKSLPLPVPPAPVSHWDGMVAIPNSYCSTTY